MKHIILAGMPLDLNLGDPAIFETTRKMIEFFYARSGEQCRIDSIDLRGRTLRTDIKYRDIAYMDRRFLKVRLKKLYAKHFKKEEFFDRVQEELTGKTVRIMLEEIVREHKPDAVIFAGGGLIKCKTQNYLVHSVNDVIKACEAFQIPVMFSAVGVEDADRIIMGKDKLARKLKRTLNSPMIRVVTTRDDIISLKKMLYHRKDIQISQVADPACSIARFYPDTEKGTKRIFNRIGIGVARGELFTDNGINVNAATLIDLYKKLYLGLAEKGYHPVLFANGLPSEDIMLDRIEQAIREDSDCQIDRAERPYQVKELVTTISSFDLVIAARLHASIIAYSYDIPSLALVWNQKIPFFYKTIGYPNRAIEYINFRPESIVDCVREALNSELDNIDKEAYIRTTEEAITSFLETV